MFEYYSERHDTAALPAAHKTRWHIFPPISGAAEILLVPQKETLDPKSSLSLLPFIKWINSSWLNHISATELVVL